MDIAHGETFENVIANFFSFVDSIQNVGLKTELIRVVMPKSVISDEIAKVLSRRENSKAGR